MHDERTQLGQPYQRAKVRRERLAPIGQRVEQRLAHAWLQILVLILEARQDDADEAGGVLAQSPVVFVWACAQALAEEASEHRRHQLVKIWLHNEGERAEHRSEQPHRRCQPRQAAERRVDR